jgi:hypothetical protein
MSRNSVFWVLNIYDRGDTWRITIRGIYVLAPNSAAYVCGTSASLLRDDAPAAYRSSLILDGAALFLKSVLQALSVITLPKWSPGPKHGLKSRVWQFYTICMLYIQICIPHQSDMVPAQ